MRGWGAGAWAARALGDWPRVGCWGSSTRVPWVQGAAPRVWGPRRQCQARQALHPGVLPSGYCHGGSSLSRQQRSSCQSPRQQQRVRPVAPPADPPSQASPSSPLGHAHPLVASPRPVVATRPCPLDVGGHTRVLQAEAVVIATGAAAMKLPIKGLEQYWNNGISACAVCDGSSPLLRWVWGGVGGGVEAGGARLRWEQPRGSWRFSSVSVFLCAGGLASEEVRDGGRVRCPGHPVGRSQLVGARRGCIAGSPPPALDGRCVLHGVRGDGCCFGWRCCSTEPAVLCGAATAHPPTPTRRGLQEPACCGDWRR